MAELFGKVTGVDQDTRDATKAAGWDWLATHPGAQLHTSAFAHGESDQCDMRARRGCNKAAHAVLNANHTNDKAPYKQGL